MSSRRQTLEDLNALEVLQAKMDFVKSVKASLIEEKRRAEENLIEATARLSFRGETLICHPHLMLMEGSHLSGPEMGPERKGHAAHQNHNDILPNPASPRITLMTSDTENDADPITFQLPTTDVSVTSPNHLEGSHSAGTLGAISRFAASGASATHHNASSSTMGDRARPTALGSAAMGRVLVKSRSRKDSTQLGGGLGGTPGSSPGGSPRNPGDSYSNNLSLGINDIVIIIFMGLKFMFRCYYKWYLEYCNLRCISAILSVLQCELSDNHIVYYDT
jgi:hypothetical protein